MEAQRLTSMIPMIGAILVAAVMIHALVRTSDEIAQWPKRLFRFILSILAGVVVFAMIYLVSGALISSLGYTYNDKPLLRLAHLTCVLAAYPAGLAAGAIFRSKHVALICGIMMVIAVHLMDKGSYLGKMVFSDPAIPINGDFALTNMALIMIVFLIGGEMGLKKSLAAIGSGIRSNAEEVGHTVERAS